MFTLYELPSIYKMPAISRTFLNESMRMGIPDVEARQKTITLYVDKPIFRSALDIPNKNDVHLFLVDKSGNILWRDVGEYNEESVTTLIKTISKF